MLALSESAIQHTMPSKSRDRLANLTERGYQIEYHAHAEAILGVDFPSALDELSDVLTSESIPVEEIIGSGGGETKGTQRLRRGLAAKGWNKTKFEIRKIVNGVQRESITHEIDHVRAFAAPEGEQGKTIALEIEWNNKDPFFDRDLENFKRLHAEGAISVGIIVTRGTSLQNELRALVERWANENKVDGFERLAELGVTPTAKQKKAIAGRVDRKRDPIPFRRAWVEKFVGDKYGAATTHWSKLEDRVSRGVGNPCPLLLIGLPASIVTFGEHGGSVARFLEEEGEEFHDEE